MGGAVGMHESVIVELEDRAVKNESERCHKLRPHSGQQDSSNDDGQRIEEVQRTVPASGLVYDQADHDEVGQDLQRRLQAMLAPEGEQDYIEERNGIPQQHGAEEKAQGQTGRRQLRDRQLDSEQEGEDQDPYFDQPRQPIPLVECRLHRGSNGFEKRLAGRSKTIPPANRIVFLAGQFRDHGEQRHVERNYDAADGYTEQADNGRLQHGEHVLGGGVHFFFVEVSNLLQHAVHGAGGFADSDHLGHHVGKHSALSERIDDGAAFFDGLAHLHQGFFQHRVARGSGGDGQTFQNGDTRGDQSAQSAREPAHRDLAQQRADDGQMEQELVEVITPLGALPDRFKAEDPSHTSHNENPPETLHESAQPHHDAGGK